MGCFSSQPLFPTISELTLEEKKKLLAPSTWTSYKSAKYPITISYPATWILQIENSKINSLNNSKLPISCPASFSKKDFCPPKQPLYQITIKSGYKHFPHHRFCTAELAVIVDEVPRKLKKTEDQSNANSDSRNGACDEKEDEPITLDEFLKISPILAAQSEKGNFLAKQEGAKMVFLPTKQADGTQSRLESLIAFSTSGKLVYSINFFVADIQYYEEFLPVAQKFFDSIAINFNLDTK